MDTTNIAKNYVRSIGCKQRRAQQVGHPLTPKPLLLLAKLLSDLITGIQHTACCHKNGIQSDMTRKKF